MEVVLTNRTRQEVAFKILLAECKPLEAARRPGVVRPIPIQSEAAIRFLFGR